MEQQNGIVAWNSRMASTTRVLLICTLLEQTKYIMQQTDSKYRSLPIKAPREKSTRDAQCRAMLTASGNVSNGNTSHTVHRVNQW